MRNGVSMSRNLVRSMNEWNEMLCVRFVGGISISKHVLSFHDFIDFSCYICLFQCKINFPKKKLTQIAFQCKNTFCCKILLFNCKFQQFVNMYGNEKMHVGSVE